MCIKYFISKTFLQVLTREHCRTSALQLTAALFFVLIAPLAWGVSNMGNVHLSPATPGVSGELNLGFGGAEGNTEKMSFSLDAHIDRVTHRHTTVVLVGGVYGESDQVKDTEEVFFHVRHIRPQTSVLSWDNFAQVESNTFTRLNYRALIGSGARWQLFGSSQADSNSGNKTFLGLGAFIEREKLEAGSDAYVKETDATRGNMYFITQFRVNTQSMIKSSTYWQPDLEQLSDARALQDFTLEIAMANRVNLALSLKIKHDTEPPAGVEHTDITYQTGVSVKF